MPARHPEHPHAATVPLRILRPRRQIRARLGEIVADPALGGTTGHPIALFDPLRDSLKAPDSQFATLEGDITT